MKDCIFCKISNNEIATSFEYEDDEFLAFNDISPKARIHILIIPRMHHPAISSMNKNDFNIISKMFVIARNIAKRKKIDSTGYRLIINSGKDAGMELNHLHLHLLGGEKLNSL